MTAIACDANSDAHVSVSGAKRKRDDELDLTASASAVDKKALAPAQSSATNGGSPEVLIASPAILAACREALVESPAAARAALSKFRTSINPALAEVLEVVGGYVLQVTSKRALLNSIHLCKPQFYIDGPVLCSV
jgi:hypothetical protein